MNADNQDFKFRIRFNRQRRLLEVEFTINVRHLICCGNSFLRKSA